MVGTLGDLGLERCISPLTGNRCVKSFALLCLGLIEQFFGQRPGPGDQRRIKPVIDDRCESISFKAVTKRLTKSVGVGMA